MDAEANPFLALAALGALFFAAWLVVYWAKRPRRRFLRELGTREPLDAATFAARYYRSEQITPQEVDCVRRAYAARFGVEPERLRPEDNLYRLFARGNEPAWQTELEGAIGVEFSAGDLAELDGSLDRLLRVATRRRRASKKR